MSQEFSATWDGLPPDIAKCLKEAREKVLGQTGYVLPDRTIFCSGRQAIEILRLKIFRPQDVCFVVPPDDATMMREYLDSLDDDGQEPANDRTPDHA